VEVYNVLGAGDAFMSGFLRGWLRGEPLETCCTYANACGAFAVSRLLCSPESPTWAELAHFLAHGSKHRALRFDAGINHVHWATTRRPQPATVMALAIDHRAQLEVIAAAEGAAPERINVLKTLAVRAAARVAQGRPSYGMLLDRFYGREALFEADALGFWLARPVELPGSRPLEFDGMADLGSHLAEWPVTHTVKCLCFYHPDDPEDLKQQQEKSLLRLYDACRTVGRELLVEIIAGKHGRLHEATVASVVARLYDIGIRPDWWKLEAQESAAAWANIGAAIAQNDPFCRGVVMLGLDAPAEALARALRIAAGAPVVKGFAVGRTIFAEPAKAWLGGRIDDETAIAAMAQVFGDLVAAWQAARQAQAA
jgi:5-dehydro-2-deoxygluconokinase